jgi:hypothetical protein
VTESAIAAIGCRSGFNRILAALFLRPEDAHQDGLAVGAALAAVWPVEDNLAQHSVALQELLEVARERIRKAPDRYVDHIFGEHEFGGTSWLTLAGVSFTSLGLEEGVTHEPLPAIATSYLGVVPLVITIYPGLLLGLYAFNKRRQTVADQEREAAVADATATAEEESQKKIAANAVKAKKDKERAVDLAVKKALAEQQKEDSP